MSKKNILLLNFNYRPIGVLTWKKGVGLVIGRGKAEVLAKYDGAPTGFNAAVVRLTVKTPDYFTLKNRFSKKNIFLRDCFQCQYCGIECTAKNATIDHVKPKSAGGPTSYTNCVLACRSCNFYKDNRTPSQAGMVLMTNPKPPSIRELFNVRFVPDEWKSFVGYNE